MSMQQTGGPGFKPGLPVLKAHVRGIVISTQKLSIGIFFFFKKTIYSQVSMKTKPLEATFTYKYFYPCFSGAHEQDFLYVIHLEAAFLFPQVKGIFIFTK